MEVGTIIDSFKQRLEEKERRVRLLGEAAAALIRKMTNASTSTDSDSELSSAANIKKICDEEKNVASIEASLKNDVKELDETKRQGHSLMTKSEIRKTKIDHERRLNELKEQKLTSAKVAIETKEEYLNDVMQERKRKRIVDVFGVVCSDSIMGFLIQFGDPGVDLRLSFAAISAVDPDKVRAVSAGKQKGSFDFETRTRSGPANQYLIVAEQSGNRSLLDISGILSCRAFFKNNPTVEE